MTDVADLLLDAYDRVRQSVHAVLDRVPEAHLTTPPAEGANTVAWLVWHLTRILDDHVCGAFEEEQVWTSGGWYERFALPFPPEAHGYGQSYDDVLAVRPTAADLLGYFDATHERAVGLLAGVGPADLDRVVDEAWDPPVTLAVRLVSVVNDCLQHAGQAAYARGILQRAG